jgi:hypothetical protein
LEWLLLLLRHTLRSIIHILEPLCRGLQPPIQRILEGQQFFAVGFLGVGTIGMASITVETHSREYNTYFRTIRQILAASDPKVDQM